MKYFVSLENSGGELDRRDIDANDDPELLEKVVDFLLEIGSLRDGDTIHIREKQ